VNTDSKVLTLRVTEILSSISAVLVLSAIIMEFLPEDEAKVFVIPVLVAALVTTVTQVSFAWRYKISK
jgi:Na+-transporting NADH:ubiquinone oxidoreductase subunit NqrD